MALQPLDTSPPLFNQLFTLSKVTLASVGEPPGAFSLRCITSLGWQGMSPSAPGAHYGPLEPAMARYCEHAPPCVREARKARLAQLSPNT